MTFGKLTLITAPLLFGAAMLAVTPARAGTLDTSAMVAASRTGAAVNTKIVKADFRYRRRYHRRYFHRRYHHRPFVTFGFGYPYFGYGYPYYGYGYPTVGLGIYGFYGGHHRHFRRFHREHDHH